MIRKIIRFPNPVLRKKSKAVKKVTPEIVKLIDDMIEAMHAAPGVGLAAPQVGELVRVIVADARLRPSSFAKASEDESDFGGQVEEGPMALVNPKIVEKRGKQTFTEGCLSLPGIEAPIERASSVVVKGLDRAGKNVKIEAEGLLATVFQHEIDHLEGFVFIDRVSDPSLIKHVAFEKEKKEELI